MSYYFFVFHYERYYIVRNVNMLTAWWQHVNDAAHIFAMLPNTHINDTPL